MKNRYHEQISLLEGVSGTKIHRRFLYNTGRASRCLVVWVIREVWKSLDKCELIRGSRANVNFHYWCEVSISSRDDYGEPTCGCWWDSMFSYSVASMMKAKRFRKEQWQFMIFGSITYNQKQNCQEHWLETPEKASAKEIQDSTVCRKVMLTILWGKTRVFLIEHLGKWSTVTFFDYSDTLTNKREPANSKVYY